MDLYKQILKNFVSHYRNLQKEDNDYILKAITLNHKKIKIFENFGMTRVYTIYNPKYITKNFLKERLIITKTAKECFREINKEQIINWLYENLPKYMYMTLQNIFIICDEEKDYKELFPKVNADILLECDFVQENLLGVNWWANSTIIVYLKAIEQTINNMIMNGDLHSHEKYDAINYAILSALTYEIKCVVRDNPYLPKELQC